MKKEKALIVFSGGLDSTTCLFWAIKKFGRKNVSAITFDYGQRHCTELTSARRIAQLCRVPLIVSRIRTFRELGGNSLTGKIAVPLKKAGRGLPSTFVPGRNIIFMAFAAAYAYRAGVRHLVAGVCEADFTGYPDCRESTMRALERTLRLGMAHPFKIHTPLIRKTKAASVRLARSLGAFGALAMSHTCYNGRVPPCGKCMACRQRAAAFKKADLPDPLITRTAKRSR
jgi:7-cyano-7-deazaguanine synthase